MLLRLQIISESLQTCPESSCSVYVQTKLRLELLKFWFFRFALICFRKFQINHSTIWWNKNSHKCYFLELWNIKFKKNEERMNWYYGQFNDIRGHSVHLSHTWYQITFVQNIQKLYIRLLSGRMLRSMDLMLIFGRYPRIPCAASTYTVTVHIL